MIGFRLPKDSFFMWYYDEKSKKLAPLLTEVMLKEDVTLGLLFFENKAPPLIFIDTLEDLGGMSLLIQKKNGEFNWNPIPENVEIPSNPDLYNELRNIDFKLVLIKEFVVLEGKSHLFLRGITFKDVEHDYKDFLEEFSIDFP